MIPAARKAGPAVSRAKAPAIPPPLRNVYTCEQFAAEVLASNRKPDWVRAMCKARKIKTVARHPWIIPQSEAIRFIAPKS